MTITARQLEVLEVLSRWIDAHGYAPSLRQLARGLGVCPSVAHGHLALLRRVGAVAWEDRRPRTLRVLWRPEKEAA